MSNSTINKDLLHKYFSGNTSIEELQQIQTWMEASEENRISLIRERKLYDLLILHADETVPKTAIWYKKSFVKEMLRIAAVFIILFSMAWGYNSHEQKKLMTAMNTIQVPFGQRVNIILPDGTDVWLNSGTKMTYPLLFAKKTREVYMDGEGYFAVSRNKKKPFIVNTYAGKVEVLGTKFNLIAKQYSNHYETALLEGKVRVYTTDNLFVDLHPNQKSVLEQGQLIKQNINDYASFDWRDGLISFQNMPFDQIINKMEQTYDVKIIITNADTKQYNYTGKFRYTDGVEYALRVLQRDIRFKFEKDDDNNIIYIR